MVVLNPKIKSPNPQNAVTSPVTTRNTQHVTRNPAPATRNTTIWRSIDFEQIGYREAWEMQGNLIIARKERRLKNDIVLFLEHPSVFTLGRRGGRECLLVSEDFLEKADIQVIQVERGGNITFHGPGQMVVYPIVDLQAAGIKVVDFVNALEEVMLRTAQNWGIAAERNSLNRGIWVGPHKLGSIGIAIRRGISFHGLALNVHTDLTPFSWIQPCGLQNVAMTTMQQETALELSMPQVRRVIKKQFEKVFGVEFIPIRPADLNSIVQNSNYINLK